MVDNNPLISEDCLVHIRVFVVVETEANRGRMTLRLNDIVDRWQILTPAS